MLEVRNLTKIYTPKKGEPVKALDNVSIKFEDRGMVFVLGKSGSGKSTLLNLMGGLDSITSGEVIVKGKTSKDFSQSDFDSYRNTFIGFIFQEYNILNEFSVGQNIGLALELQGKKADKAAIDDILKQVDLENYAQRKPGELSGGQKQRIAIARALIKDPEIIMADEPTGALDSNTGRQVFETLQKLSKTKLVIIISHDREYAEFYGDRVIEFADGHVISDIKKYKAESQTISAGISLIDGKIVHVKKGHKFTNTEKEELVKFLEDAESDIILSKDEKSNTDFRRDARIDEHGNKEAFEQTSEKNTSLKEYDPKNFRMIRSRLPLRKSIRIGASSLKVKPIRLFFTILLSAIAFGLFGLADTLGSYDKVETAYSSIQEADIKYATFAKSVNRYPDDDYVYYYESQMTETDYNSLTARFSNYNFHKIYSITNYNFSIDQLLYEYNLPEYYTRYCNGIYEGTAQTMADNGFTVIGEYPDAVDEIAIPYYLYESFKKGNIASYASGSRTEVPVNSENDVIGQIIDTNQKKFKITGIINTNFDSLRYDTLKTDPDNSTSAGNAIGRLLLSNEIQSIKNYSYHSAVFACEGFAESLKAGSGYISPYDVGLQFFLGQNVNDSLYVHEIAKYSNTKPDGVHFFDSTQTALADDEILITPNLVAILTNFNIYDHNDEYNEFYNNSYINFCNSYFTPELKAEIRDYIYEEFLSWYDPIDNAYRWDEIMQSAEEYADNEINTENFLSNRWTWAYEQGFVPFSRNEIYNILTDEEIRFNFILFKTNFTSRTVQINYSRDYTGKNYTTLSRKIVGIDINANYYSNSLVFSEKDFNEIVGEIPTIKYVTTMFKNNKSQDIELIKFSYKDIDNVKYELKNAVSQSLNDVNDMIEMLAKIFLYAGIGFAVFAAFLLLNFIATSIAHKKSEIGILRAVGARSGDVFGIFFSESAIIALISFALAFTAAVIGCFFLNRMVREELNLLLNILVIGVRQFALMLGVSLGTAFIASFLPVYNIARKKPIDAIRK